MISRILLLYLACNTNPILMKHLLTLLALSLIVKLLPAQVITIGNTGDYPNLEAAQGIVFAGDTLLLEAQIFADGAQFLENLNGTNSAPIVIMAQNEHQSVFQGGTEAIHLINCSYIELNGLVFEQQTGNGVNIDDGGDYDTPSEHITIRNCIFRDMAANGNNDLLKMSGVDHFLIEKCSFTNGGSGGSGIDFVGCHWGTVQDCYFDNAGTTGIQNKGGTQFIRIQRNTFKNIAQRALNLGGSTGLQYFRPSLPSPIVEAFEAADIDVSSNVFIGNWAPIAYVGCVRTKVYNNTFYQPQNWVIRILQENTTTGFLPCMNNEFKNNIVYLHSDLTEVNIGPNTAAETFNFSNNLWYNASSNTWSPSLPVTDVNQVIADPLFEDSANENFNIPMNSPAVGAGLYMEAFSSDFNQALFNDPPSIGAFEGDPLIIASTSATAKTSTQLFPNPASSSVQISGSFSQASIQVVNTLGQIILSYEHQTAPCTIDISALNSGLYFVLVKEQEHKRWQTSKLIKN